MHVPIPSLSSTLALVLGAGLAQAQFLINDLSFGYSGNLGKGGSIPNFDITGTQQPQVLSNKIILTPVAPGNQRAAIWAENKLEHTEWIADLDFRATGPERGGGNLNIWLTSRGPVDVSSNSVYTVGRFDGLVLVVDTHGGSGGMLRGFLNDGSTDYSTQKDIAALAFGHCLYPYRNLGRPSQIKMRQRVDKFSVEVDGRLCFETDQVRIPSGYQFGVTAASADNPDSFEIFKFVVMAESLDGQNSNTQGQPPAGNNNNNNNGARRSKPPVVGQKQQQQRQQQRHQKKDEAAFDESDDGDGDYDPFLADDSADLVGSSAEQFADLHNRLQSMTRQIGNIFRTVSKQARASEQQKSDVASLVETIKTDVIPRMDALKDLELKINNLEREIRSIRKDVNNNVKNSERALKSALGEHHRSLATSLSEAIPGHTKLVFVVIGSQAVAAIGYYLYKRRRAHSPKKYL
ncbi:hypothetical protein ACRALDRAFT_1058427 [Sodiomyces alcalophilus JCM 7366]|uniref:uncharacterized protein n=1 Tax=Sodiomyces alcalophilus JCM 7366 TaxID=591952 RepID=UPI0039B4C967